MGVGWPGRECRRNTNKNKFLLSRANSNIHLLNHGPSLPRASDSQVTVQSTRLHFGRERSGVS